MIQEIKEETLREKAEDNLKGVGVEVCQIREEEEGEVSDSEGTLTQTSVMTT